MVTNDNMGAVQVSKWLNGFSTCSLTIEWRMDMVTNDKMGVVHVS